SDDLRLALVENLKVFFTKIPDGMSRGIADHGAHHHQLHVHFECGGFIVRSEFFGVLFAFRSGRVAGSRSLRRFTLSTSACRTNDKPDHAEQKTRKDTAGEAKTACHIDVWDRPLGFRRTPHKTPATARGRHVEL